MKKESVYNIYFGLMDKNNNLVIDFDSFKLFISEVLKELKVNYLISLNTGGYLKNDESYIIENIVKLTVFDVDAGTINKIGLTIKNKLNQECVIITKCVLDYEIIY